MNKKVTLNLDAQLIESAKNYAKINHTSVTKLVKNYLISLTEKKTKKPKVSPLVKSLTGIIPNEPISKSDYLR